MGEAMRSFSNITEGLVDQDGKPMDVFNSTTTWGITRETCYKYCGPSKLQQVGYGDVEWASGIDPVSSSSKFDGHQAHEADCP